MRSKSAQSSLIDIRQNIELARSFVHGLSFEQFRADRKTVYAATRCLEIISEASRRLPDEFRLQHSTLPWRKIAGSGNIYRHDYEAVDDATVWDTLKELEGLRLVVEQELSRFEGNP
jgi:uncharacterized protein with HEPN domain